MSEVLCRLIGLGNEIGTVTSAVMDNNGYLSVSGNTNDGKRFSLVLNLWEVEQDGN